METLKKRLKVFNELNLPVMNYYQAKNKVRPVIFKRHSNIFFLEPFFNTYSVDHKFFFLEFVFLKSLNSSSISYANSMRKFNPLTIFRMFHGIYQCFDIWQINAVGTEEQVFEKVRPIIANLVYVLSLILLLLELILPDNLFSYFHRPNHR